MVGSPSHGQSRPRTQHRYRIAQGQAVREGSDSRDLRHALRTGELRFLNIDEPIQSAIARDLRARAALILDQIS